MLNSTTPQLADPLPPEPMAFKDEVHPSSWGPITVTASPEKCPASAADEHLDRCGRRSERARKSANRRNWGAR